MEASEAHLTIAYSSQTGLLPNKDPEFWLTTVVTVPDETIQLLVKDTVTDTFLPGVYPYLYKYVSQGCKPTTIDPEFADKALMSDREKILHDFSPTDMQMLAVSEDCHLPIFTALGHS